MIVQLPVRLETPLGSVVLKLTDWVDEMGTSVVTVQLDVLIGIVQERALAAQVPLVTIPTVPVNVDEVDVAEMLNVKLCIVVAVPGVIVFAVLVVEPVSVVEFTCQ